VAQEELLGGSGGRIYGTLTCYVVLCCIINGSCSHEPSPGHPGDHHIIITVRCVPPPPFAEQPRAVGGGRPDRQHGVQRRLISTRLAPYPTCSAALLINLDAISSWVAQAKPRQRKSPDLFFKSSLSPSSASHRTSHLLLHSSRHLKGTTGMCT
jgi:hypothetical protein